MRYRKTAIIEAFQWTGDKDQTEDPIWIVNAIKDQKVRFLKSELGVRMAISTLEGVMVANQGDYIIKGVEGEIYPCKAEIFEKTYTATNSGFFFFYKVNLCVGWADGTWELKTYEVSAQDEWQAVEKARARLKEYAITMKDLKTYEFNNIYDVERVQ